MHSSVSGHKAYLSQSILETVSLRSFCIACIGLKVPLGPLRYFRNHQTPETLGTQYLFSRYSAPRPTPVVLHLREFDSGWIDVELVSIFDAVNAAISVVGSIYGRVALEILRIVCLDWDN